MIRGIGRQGLIRERTDETAHLAFSPVPFGPPFPAARGSFRQTRVHFGVVSLLAEPIISRLLQGPGRGDGKLVVRLHEDNLTGGTHETKEQGALAWMRGDQFLH